MANTATAKSPLPISIWGATFVTPVECTFDTTGTDLVVYTPTPGNMTAIVGILYSEATAHNISLTSGSDLECTLELSANGGMSQGIGRSLVYVTQPGQALKIQTSAAISGPMIIYIIEAFRFKVEA